MKSDLIVLRYCAEEVERQHDGPLAVFWMFNAWKVAEGGKMTLESIRKWASLVKPSMNSADHWRRVGVRVGQRICPQPQELGDLMARWFENLPSMTPEEAYKTFEEIHPFQDGNGRLGKIIYNHLRGTMLEPAMPPNFFGCANP